MPDLSVTSSTSALSTINQNPWAQQKSEFQQLGQALQSGNLAGAQQAFSALQQNAPQGPSGQSAQGNSSQSPFAALGQALQSGNLSAAQQAFSQLQQAGGHHHHRHHGSQGSSSSTSTSDATAVTTTTDGSSSGVNLTV
jgi:hypothetical protein